jgi:hypothetical protein
MLRLYITSLLALVIIITSSSEVNAGERLQVIESNVQKYRVGDRVDKERIPESSSLPLGGVVRFWDPNSKSTMVIQRLEPDAEEGGTRDFPEAPPPQAK